jgi:hypothetical protein
MALYVVGILWGEDMKKAVAKHMEYPIEKGGSNA